MIPWSLEFHLTYFHVKGGVYTKNYGSVICLVNIWAFKTSWILIFIGNKNHQKTIIWWKISKLVPEHKWRHKKIQMQFLGTEWQSISLKWSHWAYVHRAGYHVEGRAAWNWLITSDLYPQGIQLRKIQVGKRLTYILIMCNIQRCKE